jgi:hypothetical protein
MSRIRYSLNDAGELVDRNGGVLGKLVALTVEVTEEEGGTIGGEEMSPPKHSAVVGSPDVALTSGGGTGEGETDAARSPGEQIEHVWAHYVETMKPRKRDLDEQTRTMIRAALKVATEVECCDAITGCSKSSFHMGRDPQTRGRSFKTLSHILKGKRGGRTIREQIDFFIDVAERHGARSGRQSGVTSADASMIRQARRNVLDAFEFPGDELVVRRGESSARWLRAQGWRVVPDPGGRPRFFAPGEGD